MYLVHNMRPYMTYLPTFPYKTADHQLVVKTTPYQIFTTLTSEVSWKNWIEDHWITGSPDQGSVQNESNKFNKLIGMTDCSST